MVVDVYPAGDLGAVFEGGESALAKEETAGGVGGAEVFVLVETSKNGAGDDGVVRKLEEFAGDCMRRVAAKLDARVSAEIVEPALDCRSREGPEESGGWGDRGRGAVRMKRAVDEEKLGHETDYG